MSSPKKWKYKKKQRFKQKNILLRFFKCYNKKIKKSWIINSLFVTLGSLLFPVFLGYFGDQLGLINIGSNGNSVSKELTPLAIAIILLYSLFGFLNIASDAYLSSKTDEDNYNSIESQNKLHMIVSESVNYICRQKVDSQLSYLQQINNNRVAKKNKGVKRGVSVPRIYTNPDAQLRVITDQLNKCIVELLSEDDNVIESSDLKIDIVYKYPKVMTGWDWAVSVVHNMSNDKIDDVSSTFGYLLSVKDKKPAVFFNSKQEASLKGKYLGDASDYYEDDVIKGSIACFYYDFRDSNNDIYIQAMIGIETFKNPMIPDSELENKTKSQRKEMCQALLENMKYFLLDNFKFRIGVELANNYMILLSKNP